MFALKEIFEIPNATQRPVLKLKLPLNNNVVNEGAVKIKKCLFGKCNPDDTLRLLDEQKEIDRKRILERFGIDLNSLDDFENENRNVENKKPSYEALRKSNGNRKRKLPSKQNCRRLTDFYKVKKACIQEKENKP